MAKDGHRGSICEYKWSQKKTLEFSSSKKEARWPTVHVETSPPTLISNER
jgi:hypothetical protein